MKVVLIHGAKASNDSWLSLQAHLPQQKIYLPYKSEAGFHSNLKGMLETLEGERDLFVLAHSLGGIYALHLLGHLPGIVLGGCTISTPYAGSKTADWMKYMVPSQLLRDVGTYSKPITESRAVSINVPWTQLVSTSGEASILPMEPNDGVVTWASMRSRDDMVKIDVDANHFEILVKPATADIVIGTVFDAAQRKANHEYNQNDCRLHNAALDSR
jgi:pimeloyl-ACP methyl ester carboxylesterase